MVRIITALEVQVLESALSESIQLLLDYGADERELTEIVDALQILRGLQQKNIEDVIDE